MTALTHQKIELRIKIRNILMDRYDKYNYLEKRSMMETMISNTTSSLSVNGLKEWLISLESTEKTTAS
jgi:hypothetical protein